MGELDLKSHFIKKLNELRWMKEEYYGAPCKTPELGELLDRPSTIPVGAAHVIPTQKIAMADHHRNSDHLLLVEEEQPLVKLQLPVVTSSHVDFDRQEGNTESANVVMRSKNCLFELTLGKKSYRSPGSSNQDISKTLLQSENSSVDTIPVQSKQAVVPVYSSKASPNPGNVVQ